MSQDYLMLYFTGAKGSNKFGLLVVTIINKETTKNNKKSKHLLVCGICFFTFQQLYPMNFDIELLLQFLLPSLSGCPLLPSYCFSFVSYTQSDNFKLNIYIKYIIRIKTKSKSVQDTKVYIVIFCRSLVTLQHYWGDSLIT